MIDFYNENKVHDDIEFHAASERADVEQRIDKVIKYISDAAIEFNELFSNSKKHVIEDCRQVHGLCMRCRKCTRHNIIRKIANRMQMQEILRK